MTSWKRVWEEQNKITIFQWELNQRTNDCHRWYLPFWHTLFTNVCVCVLFFQFGKTNDCYKLQNAKKSKMKSSSQIPYTCEQTLFIRTLFVSGVYSVYYFLLLIPSLSFRFIYVITYIQLCMCCWCCGSGGSGVIIQSYSAYVNHL